MLDWRRHILGRYGLVYVILIVAAIGFTYQHFIADWGNERGFRLVLFSSIIVAGFVWLRCAILYGKEDDND